MKLGSTRHWTDWVGMLVFTAIGVRLWRQAPEVGVLLLPSIVQELIVAISFLLRPRPRLGLTGWAPRLIAYANTFVIMIFLWYASASHPEWLRPTPNPGLRTAGAVLWLGGVFLSLWPLWYLRRSFSVEPEARNLVT